MKIALVHDYLNQYGGAERVLEVFMELFPDAPIYTLLYDKNKTLGRFEGRTIITSFLDYKFVRNHHRLFLPLMPLAVWSLNLRSEYDLIISDTAGYGKGINHRHGHRNCRGHCGKTIHISYCHTPLRYAWETKDYVRTKFGKFLGSIIFVIVSSVAWYLRRWDFKTAQRPDVLLTNSNFIAGKIKKYYKREARVLYPPVLEQKFYYDDSIKKENYYVATGRLIHYKRFDLIIDAFKENKKSLLVVGSGPEEKGLKERVRGYANIKFIPFVNSEDELRKLYTGAKALIFAHTEDFGLVLAEAQSCGTPAVAYADGGALEIVKDGETGILFKNQTVDSLISAIEEFEKKNFDRKRISEISNNFSKESFKKEIKKLI